MFIIHQYQLSQYLFCQGRIMFKFFGWIVQAIESPSENELLFT